VVLESGWLRATVSYGVSTPPFTVKPQCYDYTLLTPSNTSFLFEFINLLFEKPYGCLSNNLLDTLLIINRFLCDATSMEL